MHICKHTICVKFTRLILLFGRGIIILEPVEQASLSLASARMPLRVHVCVCRRKVYIFDEAV